MNEQDKTFARKALLGNRLTIEQVEQVRVEVDRSGRSFKDVAVERGFLAAPLPAPAPAQIPAPPPPRPPAPAPTGLHRRIPPLYLALLGGSFLIFSGLLISSVVKLRERSIQDDELALETERSRAETERKAAEASRGYKRAVVTVNEKAAREQLARARAAIARVDKLTNPIEINLALNEAFVGYNMYLQEIPDDAAVRVERADTHQRRRNYDLAIADLERAIELQPDLAPTLKDRIAQLRLFLARKPQ
jgi:tetratricopeptide (TPR) repeat protein